MDIDLESHLVGFRLNGVDKITRSEFDTDRDLLFEFVHLLDNYTLKEIKAKVKKLKVFNLSDNLFKFLKIAKVNKETKISDLTYGLVNCNRLFYSLNLGYMSDGSHYLNENDCDSMYILNLDKGVLELYRGLQSRKHNKGRYAKIKCEVGIPVALVDEVKIDMIGKLYNYITKGEEY